MGERVTTPEEDATIDKLRVGLREWMILASQEGVSHELCVTALMLFSSSGAVALGMPKDDFLKMMGAYYAIYEEVTKKSQS